jgi:hypothetical protein
VCAVILPVARGIDSDGIASKNRSGILGAAACGAAAAAAATAHRSEP